MQHLTVSSHCWQLMLAEFCKLQCSTPTYVLFQNQSEINRTHSFTYNNGMNLRTEPATCHSGLVVNAATYTCPKSITQQMQDKTQGYSGSTAFNAQCNCHNQDSAMKTAKTDWTMCMVQRLLIRLDYKAEGPGPQRKLPGIKGMQSLFEIQIKP